MDVFPVQLYTSSVWMESLEQGGPEAPLMFVLPFISSLVKSPPQTVLYSLFTPQLSSCLAGIGTAAKRLLKWCLMVMSSTEWKHQRAERS